jgi:hypothetical protein
MAWGMVEVDQQRIRFMVQAGRQLPSLRPTLPSNPFPFNSLRTVSVTTVGWGWVQRVTISTFKYAFCIPGGVAGRSNV